MTIDELICDLHARTQCTYTSDTLLAATCRPPMCWQRTLLGIARPDLLCNKATADGASKLSIAYQDI